MTGIGWLIAGSLNALSVILNTAVLITGDGGLMNAFFVIICTALVILSAYAFLDERQREAYKRNLNRR